MGVALIWSLFGFKSEERSRFLVYLSGAASPPTSTLVGVHFCIPLVAAVEVVIA